MSKKVLPVIFMIGVAALLIRTLLDSKFGSGTLLYLVVPFVISIALFFFTKDAKSQGLWWDYVNHIRIATIIFLATSALLMEGFLCILMFMPIYYLLVTVGYLFTWFLRRNRNDADKKASAFVIPALVVLLAAEGLTPWTTIPRERSATYVTVSDQDIATLKRNMAAPFTFPKKRGWFLSLFPLPDRIEAGSLGAGDIHNLHFTYQKWGFGNFHRGEMDILIAEVGPQHIRTEITRNTAYLSHYMKVDGTHIQFTPLEDGKTEISLTVRYQRLLDPAWYFGPMQQHAAKQSARVFVETFIARHPTVETPKSRSVQKLAVLPLK